MGMPAQNKNILALEIPEKCVYNGKSAARPQGQVFT